MTGPISRSPPLKIIAPAVGVDDCPLARLSRLALAVLHAQDALIALLVQVFKDVLVIDLARCGLFPAWIVAEMERDNLIPSHIDIRDQVAFGDLLMIDVVQDFA